MVLYFLHQGNHSFSCTFDSFRAKNAKVSAEYKQDHVFSNAALDLFKGPAVFGDVTLGILLFYFIYSSGADGFVVGGEIGYNVHDGKLGKYAAAVGYSGGDFGVALHG